MGAVAYGMQVQYRRNMRGDKAWFDLTDHRKKSPEKAAQSKKPGRITLDLDPEILDWNARVAAYKTAMAKLSGREDELPPEGKWTRKSWTESEVARAYKSSRDQLRAMIEACGEIPDPKDTGEMNRYVARVFAWSEQRDRKK